ncbi:hypothetical protein NQ318_022921 [Aromia moschata]|uniref:Uncharacterized protein n=1 Tax=Aromia moschata TaxID=1265417 RepID=A0AAV8YBG3_9CUCU|nr:hypothetical protein NQ318_022921 [Aromia moschata]
MAGNLGHNRRRNQPHQPPQAARNNQVAPVAQGADANPSEQIQTVNNLVPVPCYPEVSRRANALPALPAPPRRRLISESELANALSIQ